MNFKDRIFRTRQLVKRSLEQLEDIGKRLTLLEQNSWRLPDGTAAWSPLMQENCRQLLSRLEPCGLIGIAKTRLGSDGDGGYVVPEDWGSLRKLVSLGVGPENSFDLAMAEAGVEVEAYDPTIRALPATHPRIHWHSTWVVAENEGSSGKRKEASLAEILKTIPPGTPFALKTDIEGWEYPCLLSCPEELLAGCRFLVGEFHGFASSLAAGTTQAISATLQKLQRRFRLVHLHANNASGGRLLGGIFVPQHLELTFVNADHYQTGPCEGLFPTSLDRPNDSGACDLWLGSFRWGR
jgi:hypothetical protein